MTLRPGPGNYTWDFNSGKCPWGHDLTDCHKQYYDSQKDRYQNVCRIQRAELAKKYRADRKGSTEQPENRCSVCNAPLFASYHILGMVCSGAV